MQPEERDAAYLWDMLDAAQAVQEFAAGKSLREFLDDRMLRSAVERQLEVIGEAAGKVSKSFREDHPELPWRRIIAQRNVLIHEYGEIDPKLVWKVVTENLPLLIEQIPKWLPPLPDEDA
jgi:uncharacterized protein with HEPN domain